MEDSMRIDDYNPTIGISTTSAPQMDLDDLDNTITLSDGQLDYDENVSQLTFGDESSDDDDDVQLVLVRPKSKSRKLPPPIVEGQEGLEGISQHLGSSESETAFTSKSGYIKELIEDTGLGIIFSMESGLVLFSTHHICVDGERVDPDEVCQYLRPGSTVQFIEKTFENEEYRVLSSDCVLRQALGVWIGEKPSHVLQLALNRRLHFKDLARDRREFLSRIKDKDFLALDLVRSGGKIVGYLKNDIGIISTQDTTSGRHTYVFFHASDAYLYREPLALSPDEMIYDILPVGLNVRFDALKIRSNSHEVTHQACAVFVGAWPSVPHPTLLPGGEGTFAPCYTIPLSHTFYYLQLALFENMEAKLDDFERCQSSCRGPLKENFIQIGPMIANYHDYMAWKQSCVPTKFLQSFGSRDWKSVKRNYHVFSKEPPTLPVIEPTPFKVKEELDESVSVKKEPEYEYYSDRRIKRECY